MKRIIVLITALAFFIGFLFLNKHDVWFDEEVTRFIITQPWNHILPTIAKDNHPPLYYVLLKLLVPNQESTLQLRLFSLLFFALSIPLIIIFTSQISNPRFGALTGLMSALSPLFIYFATEARMYALFTFEVFLMFTGFTLFLKKPVWYYWLLTLTAGICLVYTHHAGLLYLPLILLVQNTLPNTKEHKYTFGWLLVILPLLSIIPWLLYMRNFQQPDCWCFHTLIGLPFTWVSFFVGGLGIVTIRDIFFMAPLTIRLLYFLVCVFFTSVSLRGMYYVLRIRKIVYILIPAIPLLLISILSFKALLFSPRIFIPLAPFFYLLVLYGAISFSQKLQKVILPITICLFLSILLVQYSHPFLRQLSPKKTYLKFDSRQLFR